MTINEAKQKIEVAQSRCEIDIQQAIYSAMNKLREEIQPKDIHITLRFHTSNDGRKHPMVTVKVEL